MEEQSKDRQHTSTSFVALYGTPLYTYATAMTNYTLSTLTYDGMNILSYSSDCSQTSIDETTCLSKLSQGHISAVNNNLTVSAVSRGLTLNDLTYMQDANNTICSNTVTGTQRNLTDHRSGRSYVITKRRDGYCYMNQNIAMDYGQNLTTTYSNVVNNSYSLPSSSGNFSANNTSQCISNMVVGSHVDNDTKSYGSYFSFTAASAGTATCSMTSGEVTSDICPKNWNMPSYTQFTGIETYPDDWAMLLSGKYNSTTIVSYGTTGFWRGRSVYSADFSARLITSDGKTAQASWYDKYQGYPIRCVTK